MQALPKTHHKSADAPGLHTIIDEAEVEELGNLARAENEIARAKLNRGEAEEARARARVVRVRVATVYRHMQALQFVFRLAAEHQCAPANLMRGIIWNKTQLEKLQAEEKDCSRLPWGDKLQDLLATSAFRTSGGGQDHPVLWPTILGAHAGLRMEEALQLRAEDVDTVDGIAVLRIQSGGDQHIKRATTRRIIPIHENLIRLGFLRMVEDCRARNRSWLFPDIERCSSKNRMSGRFSKTFTHYRIREDVYDPRRDFHALRTDFNTRLKRIHCTLEIRKRLIGHELRDVTEACYDPEGSPIVKFKHWVDRIRIDVSGVRSVWRDAPTLRDNVVPIGARH